MLVHLIGQDIEFHLSENLAYEFKCKTINLYNVKQYNDFISTYEKETIILNCLFDYTKIIFPKQFDCISIFINSKLSDISIPYLILNTINRDKRKIYKYAEFYIRYMQILYDTNKYNINNYPLGQIDTNDFMEKYPI